MHILFLTDNFPPEVNAPASRTFEHCREWIKAGREVTVITCAPNFPKGVLYSGYRNRLWQSEVIDGIRVVRVWSYITANEGFRRRILDYLSYMLAAVVAGPFVKGVDVVVGTSPQFFTVCAAYAVSRLKRVPFIFELRDLWPESIKAVGVIKAGFWLGLLERIELYLYRRAARIVAVTHSFKENLASRGVCEGKIKVVTNGVDLTRFKPRPKDSELIARYGLKGKFVAGYIGTHGLAHSLETIVTAAAIMRARPDHGSYCFLFLGDGARKKSVMDEAKRLGLDNVLFIDSVPKEEVPRHWSLLDVSVIHLRDSELFNSVIPSKLFESMAMGVPVLHGVRGESAGIVEREGVGLVFEPESAEALCTALTRIARDSGLRDRFRANCLNAASQYDRTAMALSMLAIIDGVTSATQRDYAAAVRQP